MPQNIALARIITIRTCMHVYNIQFDEQNHVFCRNTVRISPRQTHPFNPRTILLDSSSSSSSLPEVMDYSEFFRPSLYTIIIIISRLSFHYRTCIEPQCCPSSCIRFFFLYTSNS